MKRATYYVATLMLCGGIITPTAATEEVAGGDLGVARPARSPSTAGRSP